MKKLFILLALFLMVGCEKKEEKIENKEVYEKVLEAIQNVSNQSVCVVDENWSSWTCYYVEKDGTKRGISFFPMGMDNKWDSISVDVDHGNEEYEYYSSYSFDPDFKLQEDNIELPLQYESILSDELNILYDQCYQDGNEYHIISTNTINLGEYSFTYDNDITFTINNQLIEKVNYYSKSLDGDQPIEESRISYYMYDFPSFEEEYQIIQECIGKSPVECRKILMRDSNEEKNDAYELKETIKRTGEIQLIEDLNNQYNFDLVLDDNNKQISGHCNIETVSNYKEDYLVIRDYQAYYNRETSYTNIESNQGKVEIKRDEEDPTIVKFQFDHTLHVGDEITLDFDVLIPFDSLTDEYGYLEKYNAYSLGYNLPILSIYEDGNFICHPMVNFGEPAYSDVSNYNVKITVPEGYEIAGTGDKSKEDHTYVFDAKCVRDVVYMISDQYLNEQTKVGDTTIEAYAFDKYTLQNYLKYASQALEEQNARFGTYPYSTFSIVEWKFKNGAGGKEYPQLIQIDTVATSIKNVIVHEISHQFFYAIVGNDQYNEPWLDESIASYITNRREVYSNSVITKPYDEYVFATETYYEDGRVEYSESDHSAYVEIIYYDGNLMFYQLEDHYGKEKMNELLRTYVLTYAFKNAKSDDLIYLMKDVLGEDCYDIIYPYIADEILNQIF